MRGLISFVNDNHMDNNLKEILVYVFVGLIVNNRTDQKNRCKSQIMQDRIKQLVRERLCFY